jgi:hypothetical protein
MSGYWFIITNIRFSAIPLDLTRFKFTRKYYPDNDHSVLAFLVPAGSLDEDPALWQDIHSAGSRAGEPAGTKKKSRHKTMAAFVGKELVKMLLFMI